ncbi:MAG: hypothetical protein HOO93_00965 [Methyloglobulus sp.]|nr:hypothetical protein [Methyloglobulus sp.]
MKIPNFAQYSNGAKIRGIGHKEGSAEQQTTFTAIDKPKRAEAARLTISIVRIARNFRWATR